MGRGCAWSLGGRRALRSDTWGTRPRSSAWPSRRMASTWYGERGLALPRGVKGGRGERISSRGAGGMRLAGLKQPLPSPEARMGPWDPQSAWAGSGGGGASEGRLSGSPRCLPGHGRQEQADHDLGCSRLQAPAHLHGAPRCRLGESARSAAVPAGLGSHILPAAPHGCTPVRPSVRPQGLSFRKGTHQLYSASHDRCVKVWNVAENAYVETL